MYVPILTSALLAYIYMGTKVSPSMDHTRRNRREGPHPLPAITGLIT